MVPPRRGTGTRISTRPDGPSAARTVELRSRQISSTGGGATPSHRYGVSVVSVDAAMGLALEEAAAAAAHGDVPVGAVALAGAESADGAGGRVVGRGHNRREADGDPTAHAELLALRSAARELGTWRPSDVTLALTLRPCPT